jgi:hypothetical protein
MKKIKVKTSWEVEKCRICSIESVIEPAEKDAVIGDAMPCHAMLGCGCGCVLMLQKASAKAEERIEGEVTTVRYPAVMSLGERKRLLAWMGKNHRRWHV